MSDDDDIQPRRFVGHTYSRARQSKASRTFDQSVSNKFVPDKTDLPKWESDTTLKCGNLGSLSQSQKVSNKQDDPFNFHTENRKLSSSTVLEIEECKTSNQSPKLPSSLVVKDMKCDNYSKVQKEEYAQLQPFQSTSESIVKKEQIKLIGDNRSKSSIMNKADKIGQANASPHIYGLSSSSTKASPVGKSCLSSPQPAKFVAIQSCSIKHNVKSILPSNSLLKSNNNSSSNGSSVPPGKRYRIFKSRSSKVDESKPVVFSEDVQFDSIQHNNKNYINSPDNVPVKSVTEDDIGFMHADSDFIDDIIPSQISTNSSQSSFSTELDLSMNIKQIDPLNMKLIDPAAAREQLAARLRNIDKCHDSDSTSDLDNASECSEPLPLLETPPSSQNVLERGCHSENSAVAPRKFFKSKKFLSGGSSDLQRRIFGHSPQKSSSKASYNARSWQSNHETDAEQEQRAHKIAKKDNSSDIILIKNNEKGPKLKREVHWPETIYGEAYTSLKVNKDHKEFYTVVHNVKQTHEVQELGETQDFMDEVDYLLDSLRSTNSNSIRCLSCLKLASKCISPAFRMHIRAHGTVSKIFNLLHDACSDPSLALSASAMIFMLSRDRLSMDLDHDSLSLMLKLNEVDASDSLRGLDKTKQKVKDLLAQLQQETHAREIDLGFVSTSSLALESLLSLTSRRAGEWFKGELRSVGGLDHIVDSVKFCEKSLPDDLSQDIQKALPVLRKLDRCLRVLENISYMNPDNQTYMILYKNAILLQACTRTLRLCQLCMPTYKLLENVDEKTKELPGYTIMTCILDVLRVMLNITHDNQLGNLDVDDETSLMETILKCLTTTLWCIPAEQRFDLAILCLGSLINLVEHREASRKIMMHMKTQVKYTQRAPPKTMSAIKAVVELFVQREQAAREMEEDVEESQDTSSMSLNKSGEWRETDTSIEWITNNLNKAREQQEKQKKTTPAATKGEFMDIDEGNQSILEDDEETFTKALHKAGKHMENSIVASYAGLLLGSTIMNNKEYACYVKKLIPNEDFSPVIKMLNKFLNFMSLTTAFSATDINGIRKVIEVLEST